MRRIGLTGGIACGKSTVSHFLEKKGIPILDADQVARDIVQLGSKALMEIEQAFGSQYLLEDGSLNRIALRQLIIQDSTAKNTLERITHPQIFQAILRWEKKQLLFNHYLTIIDAALMIETGSYLRYDSIIVVRCEQQLQRERLMKRNQISSMEASKWIATQMPLSEKEIYADYIIDNSGTLEDLSLQLNNLLNNTLDRNSINRPRNSTP